MAVGVGGRHGCHALSRVEEDTGHVLAHAQIQRQNGMERIALVLVSTQRAAICPNVKVDVFLKDLSVLKTILAYILML